MTAAVPTTEPAQLRVGDTWKWRREDLTDYPAGTWTLKYAFKNAASHIEITAAADGTYFAVEVSRSTSGGYTAGVYHWVAFVESSTERYQVDAGDIEVLASYTGTTALDDRSHARTVLDAIEAVIEGRASKDQEEYQIAGRMLRRTPLAELLNLRLHYRGEVYGEQQAEAVRNGKGSSLLVVRL